MDKKKRLLILIFVLILSGIVVIFIHKNGSMKGLLINKRIETATTIQRNISFLKACCLSIWAILSFFVCLFAEDFFMSLIHIYLHYDTQTATSLYRIRIDGEEKKKIKNHCTEQYHYQAHSLDGICWKAYRNYFLLIWYPCWQCKYDTYQLYLGISSSIYLRINNLIMDIGKKQQIMVDWFRKTLDESCSPA